MNQNGMQVQPEAPVQVPVQIPDRSFHPEVLYHITEVSRRLDVQERWIRDNLLKNGCRHRKCGNVIVFLGRWIIDWFEHEAGRESS